MDQSQSDQRDGGKNENWGRTYALVLFFLLLQIIVYAFISQQYG
ncbi:MAG: hypothetical protein RLP15_07845 [Cryomorphaceae bacterium]